MQHEHAIKSIVQESKRARHAIAATSRLHDAHKYTTANRATQKNLLAYLTHALHELGREVEILERQCLAAKKNRHNHTAKTLCAAHARCMVLFDNVRREINLFSK